jgi:FkbM family methyltransferase
LNPNCAEKQIAVKGAKEMSLNLSSVKRVNSRRLRIARKLSWSLLRNYSEVKPIAFIQDEIRYRLCRWLVPPIHGFIICPAYYGIDFLIDSRDWIGKGIYYFGEYEAGTIFVLKNHLRRGDIFLDVGANIGDISCIASRFVGVEGSVYAIEPNPKNFAILNENIRINKLENVCPFQVALGGSVSTAYLYKRNKNDSGMDSLIGNKNTNRALRVAVTTIDTLIEERQMPNPSLVKIDVEGYELEVLKGARKLLESQHAPILCIEYVKAMAREKGSAEDIFDFVKSINDYSIYKLSRTKSIPSTLIEVQKEDLLGPDNIFCFPSTRKLDGIDLHI